MITILGLHFKKVPSDYVFNEDTVIVIKDLVSQLMFVTSAPKGEKHKTIRRYSHLPVKSLKQTNSEIELEYYVYHRITNNVPVVRVLATNVSMCLKETGYLWSNQKVVHKGIIKDLNTVEYYKYAMIHEHTGAVYFDYDYNDKRLINPMSKKAVTYNGHVLRRCVHPNRTMHRFTEANFPIKPEQWFSAKLDNVIIGKTNAEKQVSLLSAQLLKENFLILNKIYGVDAHYYRQHHCGMSGIMMQDFVGIKRYDIFDKLESRMVK